ncbi:MAG: tetratricopeptide repeat protein [Symploca sp. SIO2E9]|nr:tetratricopeptide repeat protein [Symploca sp. SIO2E9]
MYLSRHHCRLISATVLFYLPLAVNPLTAPAWASMPVVKATIAETAILTVGLSKSDSLKNSKLKADQLFQQGIEQFRKGQFRQALTTYQQVLKISRQIEDKAGEAAALNNLGEVYLGLGEYATARENLQQALIIRQAIYDIAGQAETLNHLGIVERRLGKYSPALELHQQALEFATTIGNRAIEAESLHNMAAIWARRGNYKRALELYEQALVRRRETGDSFHQGRTLNNIGGIYYSLGQYQQALEFYQQALVIAREIGNRASEGRILNNLGLINRQSGQYQQALEFYQQALAILTDVGDRANIGNILNSLGIVYESLGQYQEALESYQQSLVIAQEIGNQTSEANALDNIGGIYYRRGQYYQALESYKQALVIAQEIGNQTGEGNTLNNIGGVYESLGEYPQALEFLQQALVIRQEVGDYPGEGNTLNGIGIVYQRLGQYPQALESYQQALAIAQELGSRALESSVLDNIGSVYNSLGQYPQALESYQQALTIAQELGDKVGMARTLNSIAGTHTITGNHEQAFDWLQQSLAIFREIGDRPAEGIALSNIGNLLEQQKQVELAIIFYKQSINTTEEIRKDLKLLPEQQQQSFTETVANTYRRLASLLLQQDRVIEAQQILDLLKVQELDDYLRSVRGNQQTAQGSELLPQERQILSKYITLQDRAITRGKKLTQLRQIPPQKRTENQNQQIAEIEQIMQQIREDFNQFTRTPEVMALVQELSVTTGGQNLNLSNLNRLQRQLRELEQSAGLLYPLIMEERLELVLVTPYSPPIHRSVPVNREELNQAILSLRSALTDRSRAISFFRNYNSGKVDQQLTIPARQLYDWLIKPIENDLAQAEAETIIYAPDGQLRYLPLAALYDGEGWLVERFAINNITAATLTQLNPQPLSELRVLAAAFTQGSYQFRIGNDRFAFYGLSGAATEVENIATLIPNTIKLLDHDFSRQTTIPQLNDYNIVHFATHAAFVPGQPEESFILFGDGDRANLRDVETWNLINVDLIVLSACQTGIGGILGNGEEILGLGYQMEQAGALATIASLWFVDDQGTQVLMDTFYAALRSEDAELDSKITKAQALRQAQMALINGDYSGLENWGLQRRDSRNLPPAGDNRFSHPYYWAPFILIGNGF